MKRSIWYFTVKLATSLCLLSSCAHKHIMRTDFPSLEFNDILAFQSEFTGVDVLPNQFDNFSPSEGGKQLSGLSLKVCLALNYYTRSDSPLPDTGDESCQALNYFTFAKGLKAYQTMTSRKYDDMKQKMVSRTLLLFKGSEFIDGIVVSDYQRLNNRLSSIGSFLQDPDKDGTPDILRYTYHKIIHGSGKADTYENISTIITLEDAPHSKAGKSRLRRIDVPEDDLKVKRITELHRWNIFNEQPLPEYVKAFESGYQIRLFNGKKLSLTNLNDSGEGMLRYSYRYSPLEPEKVLFDVNYYETNGALWIDRRTGEMRTLPSSPIFSPAGNRFALSSNYYDEGNSSRECLFEIWSITHDYHHREVVWKCSGKEFFTEYPTWTSSTSLELKVANYNEESGMGSPRTVNFSNEAFYWKKTDK